MRKVVLLIAALIAIMGLAVVPASAQEPTIADIVVSAASGSPAEFTILLAAVQAADPGILAALSNPAASLTVFAPTDAAFEALLAQLGLTPGELLANTALLNDVLLYHVLPGEYDAAALFNLATSRWPLDYVRTLQGTFLEFTNDSGTLIVDSSWVVTPNIEASNGIVHVIGRVLLPSFAFGESGLSSSTPLAAFLSGANEVAPVVGDPDGSGVSNVWIIPSLRLVCYAFSVEDIDTITMAHIHAGAVDANGPVVVDFNPVANGDSNCVRVTDRALLNAIASNPAGYYVNIHTVAFPRGAVRGQLQPQ